MAVSFRPPCAPGRAPVRRSPTSWHRPRFRPLLELLESRTLLSSPGSLDPKFGVGGLVTTNFGANEFATAVATQPDGKIVVAGTDTALDFSTSQIALARYNKDGSLDTSFGSGGKVLTLLGVSDIVAAFIIRPDGKIIVDGYEQTSPGSFPFESLLVQYNPDGTLDTSFGNGGSVVTPSLTGFQSGAIALGPSGQIVIVNTVGFFNSSMNVAEFNLDGSLNQSFGSGGIAKLSFVQGFPTANSQLGNFSVSGDAVAVDSQGRVLVGGSASAIPFGSFQAALFRFNPDGTLDKTFGLKGSLTNVFGFYGNEVTAIAIRPNGQIVVAGQASNPHTIAPEVFAVEQLNQDGTQDLRFGFDGVVGTTIPNVNLFATGLAIQSNGDVVVVGATDNVQTFNPLGFALVRYTPDGNPDSTFGTNGIVTTFFPQTVDRDGNGSNVTNVALEPNGNIVVAGTVVDPVTGNDDFGVAEYVGTPLAPSVPPPPPGPAPVPPPLFPPFPIVFPPPQPAQGPFGQLDPAFGTGGLLTSNVSAFATGLATQADGKIVAVGSFGGVTVARFNPDGTLDQSFGTGGVVTTFVGSNAGFYGSVAIQGDGKIVVAAETPDPVTFLSDILVIRYNPDGSLDQTFGTGGIVTTSLPNGQSFTPGGFPDFSSTYTGNAITLTADGRIVVVGTAWTPNVFLGPQNNGLVIAEYDQHGNLVQGFGSGGLVIATSFTDAAGDTFVATEANGVTVDKKGRIYVVGSTSTNPDFPNNGEGPVVALLARYNPDGSPDQSFGFQGAVTNVFDVAGSSNVFLPTGNYVNAVAVRPDGKIVVAGSAMDPANEEAGFAVEQFNSDGSPDLNFGSHAIALWSVADGFGGIFNASSMVLQPNGDVVVAGSTNIFVPFSQFFIIDGFGMIRLKPDGTFDPSFGSNGVVTASFPFQDLFDFPVLLAQEPNGNLVTETSLDVFPAGFVLGLAEYTGGSPNPGSPPGFAAPSAILPGQAGGSLDNGVAAFAQPSSSSSPANQTNSPPDSSAHSAAPASLVTAGSSTRMAVFFTLLSGSAADVPSNTESGTLGALEPSAIDVVLESLR